VCRPQHVAWLTLNAGQKMSFTPAKFNAGLTETETTIVARYETLLRNILIASVGPYVITWDFKRIQQNHPEPYKIRRYTDDIVSDNFRFGQDNNIVVALPQDVTIVTKRQLSRPTRESFGTLSDSRAGKKEPSRLR
jgi:VID27 C-terminal WD40-like domain